MCVVVFEGMYGEGSGGEKVIFLGWGYRIFIAFRGIIRGVGVFGWGG